KISVSCNGVREIFKPLSEDEIEKVRQRYSNGKPYFFYLGSVHPRKNLTRLIKAYSRFRASGGPDYPLLLGGRLAWQLSEVQTAHEQSDYRSDIQFLDYLPTPEAARLLAASQALVYPSLSEGFGVPVLEAMQVDVPVITSNVTSLPEVAGDAAILIDPTSEEQLAQALLQISQNAELRNQMIERGRKQRQMFSWEKATDVVEEAIFAIAGKN
ncbi:MAG: glycosyltransferase family 1 protein, partial [Bacteroidota bacterium]